MSDNKTIDNVHVHIYGHEMLGEVISRARKNNIPYDKDMYYDFHSHGHVYLVHQQGQLTLVEDPSEKHVEEISLNGFFELYLSKEEVKKGLEVGKWYFVNRHIKIEPKALVCFQGHGKDAYGFTHEPCWSNTYGNPNTFKTKGYEYTEATPQEVEQALIEEAKRRGHAYNEYDYNPEENELCGLNNGRLESVFCNGQWEVPIDKLVELKEAHSKGAVIESMPKKWIGDWTVATNPIWDGDNYEYRIKPEEKPKVGDVIKAWVTKEDEYFIGVLSSIDSRGDYVVKFQNSYDSSIYTFRARYAKPLTQQEAIELLFGKERIDD